MLTSQTFPRPIRLIVGPEIFHATTPLGLNLRHVADFREKIIPSGMFRFDYVAFRHSRMYGDQHTMVERLKDLGIPLTPILAQLSNWATGAQGCCEFLQELLYQEDGYARNSCLKALGINRSRIQFPFGAEAFVKSLVIQTELTSAWDWNQFTLLWHPKHVH